MKTNTKKRSFRPEAVALECREVLSTFASFTAFPTFAPMQLNTLPAVANFATTTPATTVGVQNPPFNAANVNLTYGLKGLTTPNPFASIVATSPYFSTPNLNLTASPTVFPFYTSTTTPAATTPAATVGVQNPPFNAANVNLTYGLKSLTTTSPFASIVATSPYFSTPNLNLTASPTVFPFYTSTTTPAATVGVQNPPFNAANVNFTYGLKSLTF